MKYIISDDESVFVNLMDEGYYRSFSKRVIKEYAAEMVRGGLWEKSESDSKSYESFNNLLPKGMNSEGNHLFVIMDDSNDVIGDLWLQERGQELHIASIYISQSKRGIGIGTILVQWVEKWAIEKNCNFITLHVFDANKNAICFYKKLGFEKYEKGMRKNLNG